MHMKMEFGIVKVELSEEGVIRIIDYGKGMSKESIEKVKSPFYTLSKSRTRNKSGMGLRNPSMHQNSRSLWW